MKRPSSHWFQAWAFILVFMHFWFFFFFLKKEKEVPLLCAKQEVRSFYHILFLLSWFSIVELVNQCSIRLLPFFLLSLSLSKTVRADISSPSSSPSSISTFTRLFLLFFPQKKTILYFVCNISKWRRPKTREFISLSLSDKSSHDYLLRAKSSFPSISLSSSTNSLVSIFLLWSSIPHFHFHIHLLLKTCNKREWTFRLELFPPPNFFPSRNVFEP